MPPPNSYILVEGVNIYDNLFDTDQLSVIRGGSFLLKDAIEKIGDQFSNLMTLSSGASSGLFRVCDGEAAQLTDEITRFLREHEEFRFLPFIVTSCEADDLLEAKEKLLTQLRFCQLQSPTYAPDTFEAAHASLGIPCQLEGRRVAARNAERKVQSDSPRQLSLSVLRRLEHGRAMRQDHYFRANGSTSKLHEYAFTDDFEALANCEAQGVLNAKLAVIFADGNKFSRIQREFLERNENSREQAQQDFDRRIRMLRDRFLESLLCDMVRDTGRFPDAVTKNRKGEPVIRCETLLWGGDEFQFVLPAWLGLEFVQYFFEKSRCWTTPDDTPLTHALGIVFCHAKSPIHVIGELARSLAEQVKEGLGNERCRNAWDYIVLESIDYPVNTEIEHFMKTRYGKLAETRPSHLPPADDWKDAKSLLATLARDGSLSRRQPYRIIEALGQGVRQDKTTWEILTDPSQPLPDGASPQSRLERRMFRLMQEHQRQQAASALEKLAANLFDPPARQEGPLLDSAARRAWLWIHLVELWDYWPQPGEEAQA